MNRAIKVIPISINDPQIIPSTHIWPLLKDTHILNTPIYPGVRVYVYLLLSSYHKTYSRN